MNLTMAPDEPTLAEAFGAFLASTRTLSVDVHAGLGLTRPLDGAEAHAACEPTGAALTWPMSPHP